MRQSTKRGRHMQEEGGLVVHTCMEEVRFRGGEKHQTDGPDMMQMLILLRDRKISYCI